MKESLAWWQCGNIPHKAHYHSLEEAAQKLALLVDKSADWAYAFVQLNEALSYVPLLSEGHISAMMDGTPCVNACGWLHQLQICKLLQHNNMVVCPEGLNGKLEALQFSFPDLPLLNAAAPGKPTHKPQLIEVDLSSVQPKSMPTSTQAPTTTLGFPLSSQYHCAPHDIAIAIKPTTPVDIPCSLHPFLSVQHAQERATIGSPGGSALNWRNRISPWARGDRLSHPCPSGNPHADVSTGSHTRWHPQPPSCYSPAAPAHHAKDTGGGQHVHIPPGLYQPPCQINFFHYRSKWMWP